MILIFDKNGNYLCSTDSIVNASRITGAKQPNICKCLKPQGKHNEILLQTHGYYFLEQSSFSPKTEKILKIIIACEGVRGLPEKIKAISNVLNKNKISNDKEPKQDL